jgi:hypothetical protein
MRRYLVAFAVLSFVACNEGDTVVGPSEPSVKAPAPVPVVTTTSTPQVAPPGSESSSGPVSVYCEGQTCTLSNSADVFRKVNVQCTRKLDTNDWGSLNLTVPPGKDTASVNAYDVCSKEKMEVPETRCEPEKRNVQLDFTAGEGEHVGHLLTTLSYEGEDAPQVSLDCGTIFGVGYLCVAQSDKPSLFQWAPEYETVTNHIPKCGDVSVDYFLSKINYQCVEWGRRGCKKWQHDELTRVGVSATSCSCEKTGYATFNVKLDTEPAE